MMSSNKVAALAMAEVMLDSEEGAISISAMRGALRRLTEVLAVETTSETAQKFFIPTIGTDLVLTEDWAFPLQAEYRNEQAFKVFFGEKDYPGNYAKKTAALLIPSGSVLRIDRIYIRKGAGDFDSVTFNLVDCPRKEWAPKAAGGTRKGTCRFWAKLGDVNAMVCTVKPPKDEEDDGYAD